MSEINNPKKAKLIIALMYSKKEIYKIVVKKLIKKFGQIDITGDEYQFGFTKYYEKEFGEDLRKRFVTLKNLINMDELSAIKTWTKNLEEKYLYNNKRQINIDPGYITKSSVVVASCKHRPHRIYLQGGIYADLQLMFKKVGVISFKWTFEDYLIEGNLKFFRREREKLLYT